MEQEKEITPWEFIEASMVKNKNQLTLILVDIEFLSIKRRRVLLTQNPLEEQNIANQLRDKNTAKEAIEESIRILEELREKYKPALV